MKGSFKREMQALGERVGDRHLRGEISYETRYAAAHHEAVGRFSPPSWRGHGRLRYTKGGSGPKYLERPLLAQGPTVLRGVADDLLERGATGAMKRGVDRIADESARLVPEETGRLRRSRRVRVIDDGAIVFMRVG